MAISLSQFVTGTAAAVSSLNVLFSSAVSSGQAIITAIGFFANSAGPTSTVIDNVNNAAFAGRIFSTMSNASDSAAHIVINDKLNISSGAGASTYRVSANFTNTVSPSLCAMAWAGGPFTFASTASANGTSTGPQGGPLTASSTPVLFICAAIHNAAGLHFNSTVGASGPGVWLTTVDSSNANQDLNVIYSLNSSLQQDPMHSMSLSTRWLAATVLYLGAGAGGAAATGSPWTMCMTGCQDKVI